jgi:hypothetical protein
LDVTGRRNYLIHIRLGQSDTEKLRKQTFLYRDSASNKLRQHAEQQGCTPFHIVTSHDQETRILILKLIRGHGLVFRKLRLMTCHKRKPLRPPELSGTPEAVCTQRPAGRLKLTLSTLASFHLEFTSPAPVLSVSYSILKGPSMAQCALYRSLDATRSYRLAVHGQTGMTLYSTTLLCSKYLAPQRTSPGTM